MIIRIERSRLFQAAVLEDNAVDGEDEEEAPEEGSDYDYLLGMKLWSLTEEKKQALLKHRDEKEQELQKLKVN